MVITLYNPDHTELIHKFVASLKQEIAALLERQPTVVIGLSGGETYRPVWEALREVDGIDWKRIHLFLAEERLVPITDNDSIFKQAHAGFIKELIDSGRLPEANAHPYIADPVADKDPSVYERELGMYGGRFDIVLLGVGREGETAALFPHHQALDAVAAGFTLVPDAPKPPAGRVTATPPLIKQAPVIFVMVTGKAKHAALALLRDESKSWRDVPAKLALEAEKCYVVTDLG